MDEDVILSEIVKSLAFEIEAVNQENVLKWSTTNGTPLKVKVRVRSKDEPRLVQRGTMPVPKIGISAPEKLTLVSSNQTILSFSVYLQDEAKKKEEHKRHSAFKLFNIGGCLGTYSDHEGPYLPSSSNQDAVRSTSSIMSSSGIINKKLSQVLSTSSAVPRNKKRFFGKCKPGGCLDPPFGEDNYSYGLPKTKPQENLQLELNELQDIKNIYIPDHNEKLVLTLDESTDNGNEPRKRPPERSTEHETIVHKLFKDDDSKELAEIYARTTEENSLRLKYSSSIITYPTDKRSKEKVNDQTPKKNKSIKNNGKEKHSYDYPDSSMRKSYEYPESYFVPPKDITRCKEEERKHARRLSMDQFSRNSKVAANDMTDITAFPKTISKESKYKSQLTKRSIDTLSDKFNLTELKTNVSDFSSKVSVNKREITPVTQLSSGLNEILSNGLTDGKNVDILKVSQSSHITYEIKRHELQQEIIATIGISQLNISKTGSRDSVAELQGIQDVISSQSTSKDKTSSISGKNSNKNQIGNLDEHIDSLECLVNQEILSISSTSKEELSKLSSQITNKDIYGNFKDSVTTSKKRLKAGEPSNRGPMSGLPQSNDSVSSRTRRLDTQNAQKQEQVKIEKITTPTLERLVNTDIQTTSKLKTDFKNNDDQIDGETFHNKKSEVADAITSIVATSAIELVMGKQSHQYRNKPNVTTDSSAKEKDNVFLNFPEGHPQGKKISPKDISSAENCEFDISSSNSMDFKQEISSTGKTNSLMDTSNMKDTWLSAASNDIIEKNDMTDIELILEQGERKGSAILKKIPFVTKQDSDMYNDDTNKATPLKRNTFTIIGSDHSLQKSEEIEKMPKHLIDVHLKTIDTTESGTPMKTSSNVNVLENVNKVPENKYHTNSATGTMQTIKEDIVKYMNPNITFSTEPTSDEEVCSKDENTKQLGYAFNTNFDKNISDPIHNQKEILDTVTKTRTTSQKQLPVDVRHTRSNVAEDDEFPPPVQSPLRTDFSDKNDQMEYAKNREIFTLHSKSNDVKQLTESTIDLKSVLDGPIYDEVEERLSLGEDAGSIYPIPENEQKMSTSMYDRSFLTTTNENNLQSTVTDVDNKVSADPTIHKVDSMDSNSQKIKNKMHNTPDFSSILDKTEIRGQTYVELDSVNYGTSAADDNTQLNYQIYNKMNNFKNSKSAGNNLLQLKPENVQDLHALTADDIKCISTDQKHDNPAFLNTENEQTPNFLPEYVKDLHLSITDKTTEKSEPNYQINNDLDKVIYNESTTDILLNRAQSNENDEYIPSDQNYDKRAFLGPHSNEPQVEIEKSLKVDQEGDSRKYYEQNLTDDIQEVKEKSSSTSTNSSPFAGYSGIVSEVLSNISENIEGEEKQSAPTRVAEGVSRKVEDFTISDSQAYRDHETLNAEEPVLNKLTCASETADFSYKIGDGIYKVPQNSSAKSYTSTLEESDKDTHKEMIAKAFESLKLGHSSNNFIQRSDDYPYHTLNIAKDEILLANKIDIINQNSDYQSSKILTTTHYSTGLNDSDFPSIHNDQVTLAKQKERKTIETQNQSHSNVNEFQLGGSETSCLKKDPIYLNMSFYSYMNDDNQRVVQTNSPLIEQHRPHDGTVTVVKTLIRHGNEIRIPVDKKNDISLNILDKDVRISNKGGTIASPLRHIRREKEVLDLARKHDDVINKNLALIYEHELIPLHHVIKNLAQEVNMLSVQQERLQQRIRNPRRTKSLRLIPVIKRCGCRRC